MMNEARIIAAKERASSLFLEPDKDAPLVVAYAVSPDPRRNVMGVGIGPRIRDGQLTDQICVRIYVERKIARDALSEKSLLPTDIDGVPVDIIESGRFSFFLIPVHRQRLRPILAGCSISAPSYYDGRLRAGTLGAVVERNDTWYVLGANHVMADCDALPLGTEIVQPGSLDSSSLEPVARLSQCVTLAPRGNHVDCAIAEVLDRRLVTPEFLPPVGRLSSSVPLTPARGMSVEKVGRATGHTTGKIFDIRPDVKMGYAQGTKLFHDQLIVAGDSDAFSEPGDSGAAIVERSTKQAVALLVGGSGRFTIASRMTLVLEQLDVKLVT